MVCEPHHHYRNPGLPRYKKPPAEVRPVDRGADTSAAIGPLFIVDSASLACFWLESLQLFFGKLMRSQSLRRI